MAYVRAARPSLGAYRATPRRQRRSAARAGNRALGFFLVDDLLAAGAAVKGIASIASSASSMFGNGSLDQQRQARAAFFGQSALAGSVTAARYLLGGLQQTASHEQPFYQAWINNLAADGHGAIVLAEAQAQGPLWITGDTGPSSQTSQQMVNDVKQDLAAIGQSVAAPGTTTSMLPPNAIPITSLPTTRPVQSLPAVTTTAPFNYTPYLIGGGAAVLALLLSKR